MSYCATNLEPCYCCDHCDPCHVHLCFLLCHGVTLVLPSPHAASLVERLRLAITLRNQPLRQCWTTIAVYWKILKVCERLWKIVKVSKDIQSNHCTSEYSTSLGSRRTFQCPEQRTITHSELATPCNTLRHLNMSLAMLCYAMLKLTDFIWFHLISSDFSFLSFLSFLTEPLAWPPWPVSLRGSRGQEVSQAPCAYVIPCHSMSDRLWLSPDMRTQIWLR